MKILVVTFNDSDNLTIENVLYEMKNRGHQITIFAPFRDENSIRMFKDLNIDIIPIKELTPDIAKDFDVAFCCNQAMSFIKLLDIYCFGYSSYYSETFSTDGADFLFKYRRVTMPGTDFRCASMPVGDPKNDKVIYHPVHDSKRILYIDSGHMPFGREGKEQIADMLLNICKGFPDHELCIKPRWLRKKGTHFTHRNLEHIYTIIEERCAGNVPKNLTMLEEHLDLQNLIDSSVSVVTLYSGAILNVILQNKGLVIASGWANEDKWDMRNSTEIAGMISLFSESGCVVDYRDVTRYLPDGIHAKKEYEEKMFCYKNGASKRIVDVMEYVYSNFLAHGSYPDAKEYDYETYQQCMTENPSITMTSLKQERIRDIIQLRVGLLAFQIATRIDFSRYYKELDDTYRDYSVTEANVEMYFKKFESLKNQILIDNWKLLQKDPIDQDFLLNALYVEGRYSDILSLKSDTILCGGPYNYYVGMIYGQRKEISSALNYFATFLKEANARPYAKYWAERDRGISDAYNYIFKYFDGDNLEPQEFIDLYEALYEQREITIVRYQNRKHAHNMLLYVAEQLTDIAPELELKCLQLYAKWERHYNIRERDDKIKELTGDINKLRSAKLYRFKESIKWFFRKVKGGIKCLKEHGWKYTWNHGIEKIKKRIENKTWYRIHNVFKNNVMAGYELYSKMIESRGENARLFFSPPANGDTFVLGLFYHAYVKQFADCKPAFVTVDGGGKTIAEILGISDIETFPFSEFNKFYNLVMFDNDDIIRLECLHYHVFYRHTAILAYLEGLHDFNFFSMAQEYLNISDDEISSPKFDYDEKAISELFSAHDLIPKKTVVLVPYAKSVKLIPVSFWCTLAERLISLGYCVCTNSGGATEPPIQGTDPVFVPYRYSVPFLEAAGATIGIRSGFQDVTNSARCLKISLYTDDWKRSLVCPSSKSFSMVDMYHQPDQYDFLYSKITENQLIDEIVEMIVNYLKLGGME